MTTAIISFKRLCLLLVLLPKFGAGSDAASYEVPSIMLPIDATSFEFNGSVWHIIDPNAAKQTRKISVYGSAEKNPDGNILSPASSIVHSDGKREKRWNSRSSRGSAKSFWRRNTNDESSLEEGSDLEETEETEHLDSSALRPEVSRSSPFSRHRTNNALSFHHNQGQQDQRGQAEEERDPWDIIMPPTDEFTQNYLRLQGPELSYYRAIEGTNAAQAHPKFFKWLRADDTYDMPVWNMMIKHLIPVMMRVYFTEWVHYILHGAVIYAATEDWISHSNAGRNTIQPLEDVWRKVQEGAPSMRNLLGNAQLNGFRCDPRIASLKDSLLLQAIALWNRQYGPEDVFRTRFDTKTGSVDGGTGDGSNIATPFETKNAESKAREPGNTASSRTSDAVGVSISEDGDDPAIASRGHLFSEQFNWTRMSRDEAIAVRDLLQELSVKFHTMIDEALRVVDALDTDLVPVASALRSCEYGFEVAQYGVDIAINTSKTEWKVPGERDFILRDERRLKVEDQPAQVDGEDVNIDDDSDDDEDQAPPLKRPRLSAGSPKGPI